MQQDAQQRSVTVKEFCEASAEVLDLEIESGEAFLENQIAEASLNRPGLALTGFFQYFANRRIQVIGLAELRYLKSLSDHDREKRICQFFEKRIPCVVVTRNRHALPSMLRLSERYHVPVLRSSQITMHFINAATIILQDLITPRIHFQGTMVDILGVGVLIEGEPGIGKSETALALIERGHSIVSDDVTVLHRTRGGSIMGTAVDITRYHMEIRGLGIIHIPSLFGVASVRDAKRLDLVVRLIRSQESPDLDRTGLAGKTRRLLGEEIPYIELPVAPGRDMAHVVEVSALNEKLKTLGHDAAKELDEKLITTLAKRGQE